MPRIVPSLAASPEVGDSLREVAEGTRAQFESDWVRIEPSLTHTFQHGLGEIPWVVSVIDSANADGSDPRVSTVPATPYTNTVLVTNSGTTARYFKVRAL